MKLRYPRETSGEIAWIAMKCQEKMTGGALTPHPLIAAMCRHFGDSSSPIALPCDTSLTFAATTSRRNGTTECHIHNTAHNHRSTKAPRRAPRGLDALDGGVCAVREDPETSVLEAAADPRRWSQALGW